MKALLIVDVQNDFCQGGALAVPEADEIIPAVNDYIDIFSRNHWLILASRDWHPQQTKHFKSQGGVWPVHCVQGTGGAQFRAGLRLPDDVVLISKGMEPHQDSYSAFDGVDPRGMRLADVVKERQITELYVCGLATDYCVKYSALAASKQRLSVYLLTDAVKGVNSNADDSRLAIEEMVRAGVQRLTVSAMEEKDAT